MLSRYSIASVGRRYGFRVFLQSAMSFRNPFRRVARETANVFARLRTAGVVPRAGNPGRLAPERCIVLRFHRYIDKHSLSPREGLSRGPREREISSTLLLACARSYLFGRYCYNTCADTLTFMRSRCARVACTFRRVRVRVRAIKVGEVLCLYVCLPRDRARARAHTYVCGHNRLFRVDLCGALRQNVRCDPA